ncbi:MAG: hypothetical protein JWQ08_1569, partial [Deinococcus sp.]|nr:hypothetical protein [Deinococcus sp.]
MIPTLVHVQPGFKFLPWRGSEETPM